MDLIVLEQHLRHAGGLRVVVALAGVQSVHLIHFIFRQFKIKNTEVPGNPLRVGGLGQHDEPVLHLKAQDDLAGVPAVLLRQLGDNRVVSRLLSP